MLLCLLFNQLYVVSIEYKLQQLVIFNRNITLRLELNVTRQKQPSHIVIVIHVAQSQAS